MGLRPKFIQRDCKEGREADLRQAKAVLRHKPDIIIFEMPQGKYGPNTVFNKYKPSNKPLDKVEAIIASLKVSARKYPYAKSDIAVWENIKALWADGKDTLIYDVDAPNELRRRYFEDLGDNYPAVRRDWLFWVYLYIRDSFIAENIRWILDNYKGKENPIVVIFLQAIHWRHVQFFLKNPSKEEKWRYYFKNFPELKPDNIEGKIKARSKIIYKYWKKMNIEK